MVRTCGGSGGLTPQNYYTEVGFHLTGGQPSPGNWDYEWSVIRGQQIVDLTLDHIEYSDTIHTAYPDMAVVSTAASSALFDVEVQVAVNGLVLGSVELTVPTPHRMVPTGIDDRPDPIKKFQSFLWYRIEDQFNNVLPNKVDVNEKFYEAPIADYLIAPNERKTDWKLADANFQRKINPAQFCDKMGADPNGRLPVPQEPQKPELGRMKVLHLKGGFYVGSTEPGQGVLVQTHTWQFYRDHGRHEGIKSPP